MVGYEVKNERIFGDTRSRVVCDSGRYIGIVRDVKASTTRTFPSLSDASKWVGSQMRSRLRSDVALAKYQAKYPQDFA